MTLWIGNDPALEISYCLREYRCDALPTGLSNHTLVTISCFWHFPAQFVQDCRFTILQVLRLPKLLLLKVQLEDSATQKTVNFILQRHCFLFQLRFVYLCLTDVLVIWLLRCCAAEKCDSSTTPFVLQRTLVVFTDLMLFAQLSSLSSRILDSSSR